MISKGLIQRWFDDNKGGGINLDEFRQAYDRLLTQKDLHVDDLKLHLVDLKRTVHQLHSCILIIFCAAVIVVMTLVVMTCYLLGIRDEQKRSMEAQKFTYQGIFQEKDDRIHHLEAKHADMMSSHATAVGRSAPQHQPFFYALPSQAVVAQG